MEVEGPWTEVFDGSERKEASSGAEALLGGSTLTLAPLVTDSPSIRRSQPILITSNRYDQQAQTLTGYSSWLIHSCTEWT